MMHKSAWAEICIGDLEYNVNVIRSRLPANTAICGVLKADAYGHGMTGVRNCLAEKNLVNLVAVGKMSELVLLNASAAPGGPGTLLLGDAEADELEPYLTDGSFDPDSVFFSIYSMRQFREFARLGEKLNIRIRVHIRTDGWDSGMGLGYEEFLHCEDELFSAAHVAVCGLYSHLYTSYSGDTEGIEQELRRFDAFVGRVRPEHRTALIVHILNSSLVFLFPQYAYDMVRIGTALYGLPSGDEGALRPILRICGRVFDVREVDDAAPRSYVSAISHAGRRRIARIMLGYWDSPFLLTQKEVRIRIRGRLFLLADDVCMDNLAVDVSDADDITVGDIAVFLGDEGVSVSDIMRRNNVSYVHSEWFSMTAGRLEKVYVC